MPAIGPKHRVALYDSYTKGQADELFARLREENDFDLVPSVQGLDINSKEFLAAAFAEKNHSPNGYQVFPGGFIVQWATVTVTGVAGDVIGDSKNVTVSYPIPFPTHAVVVPTGVDVDGYNEGSEYSCGVRSAGTSQTSIIATRVTGSNTTSETMDVQIVAFGY